MKPILLFALFFICVNTVQTCPMNCMCEETETICTIRSCTDKIALEYTDFLTINGKLCENQRRVLNSLTPNTIILLKSDTCTGIRNCRLVKNTIF